MSTELVGSAISKMMDEHGQADTAHFCKSAIPLPPHARSPSIFPHSNSVEFTVENK